MPTEIFDSSVRSKGDLAGVFEHDGDTGYFYLCRSNGNAVEAILDRIQILVGEPDFGEAEVSVRWDHQEEKVGLFIRGNLWAVFDAERRKTFGGHYIKGTTPSIAPEGRTGF